MAHLWEGVTLFLTFLDRLSSRDYMPQIKGGDPALEAVQNPPTPPPKKNPTPKRQDKEWAPRSPGCEQTSAPCSPAHDPRSAGLPSHPQSPPGFIPVRGNPLKPTCGTQPRVLQTYFSSLRFTNVLSRALVNPWASLPLRLLSATLTAV